MRTALWLVIAALGAGSAVAGDAPSQKGGSPLENLPPYITRITHFGERADFSHDGKRVLFLEKTFGDVFEYDSETKIIRPMTHHYFHNGYVRALYLANGDILLTGAREFDPADPWPSRHTKAELWVLKKDLSAPPVALGEKCSEGPAVSRKNMKIAWTLDSGDYPDRMPKGASQMWMGDIVYESGAPKLANKKMILDSRDLPFQCNLETQSFRPPDEKELIFSAYGYQGTEVMGVDLQSKNVVNYSKSPNYNEPEGIFPDGQWTLMECDDHNPKGSQNIDVYALKLDGSRESKRITRFNDYKGYKASNPVVSDDGRYVAFQYARQGEAAGIGHGILVLDLRKMESEAASSADSSVKARVAIENLKTALEMYAVDTGHYPTSLDALRTAPEGEKNWRGPYIRGDVPKDPWNRAYIYRLPGREGREYEILSLGGDGKEGTVDDYTSWDQK